MVTNPNTYFASDEQILTELKDWPKLLAGYNKADNKKALLQLLNSMGPFVFICFLMYMAADTAPFLVILLSLVNTFFLARVFIIQHDCGHKSFFKERRSNIFVGWLCSLCTFIPYSYWASLHRFHHVHSSELEDRDIGDISILTVNEYSRLSPLQQLGYRIYRSVPVLFLIGPLYYVILHLRIPAIRFNCSRQARIEAVLTDLVYIVFYGALCFWLGWKNVLLVTGSVIAFFSVMAVWFFYVQHQHEFNYKRNRQKRNYVLAAIKGSTYYKLPKIFMWLSGNIGYHHIHHLSPGIPNYHLKTCVAENPIFQKYVTTIGFRQSISFIKHKLWDEEQQRMITFREFRCRSRHASTSESQYG